MKTEIVRLNELKLSKYNPRKISEEDLEKLKKSIKKFGFIEPMIVNKDYTLIGGHQRLKALKELGYEEVEVVKLDLNKQDEKKLNLALNRISGEWDFTKLNKILSSIGDLEYTGFDESELQKGLEIVPLVLSFDFYLVQKDYNKIKDYFIGKDRTEKLKKLIKLGKENGISQVE